MKHSPIVERQHSMRARRPSLIAPFASPVRHRPNNVERCHSERSEESCRAGKKLLRFAQCFALVSATVAAPALAGPVPLWNEITGDGSLGVTVDDFGSFGDAFQGGPQWLDNFDPSADPIHGELPENFVTFSTAIFFYIDPSETGDGTHRGVASAHSGIAATYDDGNINCVVTRPNSINNLPTATDSAFFCIGPGVAFDVELTQTVSALPTGPDGAATAALAQQYVITNTGSETIELITVKHTDMDMPWGGGGPFHTDDVVGVDFAEFVRPQIFARDDELVTADLTLRTADDMWLDPATVDVVYFTGKQTVPPPPNPHYPASSCPPPGGSGTDFQVWNNYGAPNCWKNYIPSVGHDAPGESPPSMGDVSIGMQVELRLPVGEPHDVSFVTQYGRGPQNAPPQVMHQRGWPGQTRPYSGYIDPRTNIAFPPAPPETQGLTEAYVRFSDNVFDCDGSDVDLDNFTLVETGDGSPPALTVVENANPRHSVYFRVQWDAPITLREWTTIIADVCNAGGVPIVASGAAEQGISDSDRVDVGFLPCDINQSGNVNPLDLLRFKQLVNSPDEYRPADGLPEDLTDINRDGVFNPLDLLTLKRLINGVPPLTEPWASQFLNSPQP